MPDYIPSADLKPIVPITSSFFVDSRDMEKAGDVFVRPSRVQSAKEAQRPIFSTPNIGLGVALCGIITLSIGRFSSGSLMTLAGLLTYGFSNLHESKI